MYKRVALGSAALLWCVCVWSQCLDHEVKSVTESMVMSAVKRDALPLTSTPLLSCLPARFMCSALSSPDKSSVAEGDVVACVVRSLLPLALVPVAALALASRLLLRLLLRLNLDCGCGWCPASAVHAAVHLL